jgi:hypothetical protein
MTDQRHGFAHGLTNHGDPDFSLYRRRPRAERGEATLWE